ncbi:DUF445 domain-containing protein [Thiosulfativibrio zosterae]|uniref:DUF445 domain-containing protein n=1 Tax=Thiosulfativibrio zosterae TaxID=2675053 RepID=A0A6F8PMZ4_9GAMM|nr:DUF445 domain-containing protein [Thiosulfativibrio zosterae]BBP43479.1 hypothetical protein THMIRHAT_12250 [Thiosulfativibrio zosterae]
MDKSFLTNLIAFFILAAGLILENSLLIWVGLFALSGALTNALAIHMLFEKVPGLVGSGVIPARFEAFKAAIKHLMMSQFFTQENIDRFMSNSNTAMPTLQLAPVIEKVNLEPAFDKLVEVIMQSSFGSMLSMFGGACALTPLKEPFVINLKESLIEMTEKAEFHELLKQEVDQPSVMSSIQSKVANIIDARLEELTPQVVKEMVQNMIHEHLGWLVVWGGVFGGLIGALSVLIPYFWSY